MIGRLKGILITKQPPTLLLDVNGAGYEVDAPMSTFYQLPEIGQDVTLHTHLVVREDAHMLYGFASETERSLFKSVIKINGVGAKLALTILSGMDAREFTRCVLDNDAASLVRMPGVGKKTAERLIIELRDRLQDDLAQSSSQMTSTTLLTEPVASPVSDAVSALIALGYKPPEASRMVSGVETKDLSSEDIIRLSLQSAAK